MTDSLPDLSHSKLAVIGAGSVGSSLAYAALIRGSAHEVVLYDIDESKVSAEAADLSHGTQYTPSHLVAGSSDIEIVKNSSVVIITAGAKQRPGQTRLELAATNVNILSNLLPKLLEQAPNAIYVLVTNPCDVLTVVAQKISGLPTSQVFSTGTMLDTSRLRRMIADKISIAQSNVHATIMGEHGDTEFPVWSTATIGTIPIREWRDHEGEPVFTERVLAALGDEAMHAAYRIIEGKGATNYAIGLTGARLVEALLGRERTILPLSSVLDDYHGISGIALSVPSVVSGRGIERVLDIPMEASEITMLRRSAQALQASLTSLGH
ncbi:L-lactate dehydrogenase [Propionicicella superfundia]|uniref:L-lactate dehydrogenase n=1 Tax=Propionicicella superfundia TaxID=348582 RepID=UPI00040F1A2E|nr:L-lactate dehydrogenase [Propionicicella superfundia]